MSQNKLVEKDSKNTNIRNIKVSEFKTSLFNNYKNTIPEYNGKNIARLFTNISKKSENRQIIEEESPIDPAELSKQELSRLTKLINDLSIISTELSNISNIKVLLRTLLLRSVQSLSCRKGILFRFTDEPSSLEVFASYNIPEFLQAGKKLKINQNQSLLLEILREGKTCSMEHKNFLDIESEYFTCIPIGAERGMLGILCLFDKLCDGMPGAFNQGDESFLNSLVNQTATQWKKMKLFEMASYDSLTRLYNRRFLDSKLNEEIKRARRYNHPFSIMLLDIDFFKKFNDSYGHHVGDEVLKKVARRIKESIRADVDIAGRFGGEELLIIMPETSKSGAALMAERVREKIESLPLENPFGSETLNVTVSIGVASFPEDNISPAKLLECADHALYKSKANGRNMVTVYS